VLISEERSFFRLSAFRDRLLALYEYRPEFIQPQFRLDEIRIRVGQGLRDISLSRSSREPGVPWPDDPDRTVCGLYAGLANYLGAVGFGGAGASDDEFKRYWPPNLHVVSGDALLVHSIYWPAFLMAADLPLPRHIFAHGNLSPEQPGPDTAFSFEPTAKAAGGDLVRYYLLRDVGYGENSTVDYDALLGPYNVEFQILANLTSRILALVARHCNGKVPTPSIFGPADPPIETAFADARAEVRFLLDSFNFSEALKVIWSLIENVDALLTENASGMSETEGLGPAFTDALHDACQGLVWIALLLHPILPRMTQAIWKGVGRTTLLKNQLIDETPWSCLMPETNVGKLELHLP
jgi:methionyl-tRNA synthetase